MKSGSQGVAVPDVSGDDRGATSAGELHSGTADPGRPGRPRPLWSRVRRPLGLLLVLAVIGGGVLWYRQRQAVERDAAAARSALAAGRPAAAREPLLRWVRARPSSAEPHALLAEQALLEGDLSRVKPEFNRARDLGYPGPQLERLRAVWLARIGRYAEAEPVLARIWTESPTPDPVVDETLARIYLKTYRLARAKAVIERWIKDTTTDGRPFLWLTEIDRRTEVDNPESWVQHYMEALRRDPELDPARRGLAEALRKAHRNDEAAEEFARYLSRHPEDPVALSGAGLNALEQGDLETASRLLDRALERAPTDLATLKARAEVDRQQGDLAAARRRLDQVIEADRFDDVAVYARAQVRAMQGDVDGARADRETSERLKKGQAELLAMRGRLLDHPDDSETRAKVAAWMFAHGREQDGLDWAMAILANDPDHGPTCRLLADYYARRPDGAGLANFYRAKAEK